MDTPEAFNRLIVKRTDTGARPVYLRDIGRAEIGSEAERTLVRMNGKPAVGLGIIKQSKANTLEVAQGVKREMNRLQTTLPTGMVLELGSDSSRFIESSIREVTQSLLLAVLMVIIVIFLFLGTFRATLIPAAVIPVSIIATFALLDAFGFSINTLTLLSLTLAIGLVVDDAIVVLENIVRHVEAGATPYEAAVRGMSEITFAVIATTLVLVAIFVPIAFMPGVVGRLFSEFAVALAGAVVISTFLALTLTPMMCARLLRGAAEASGRPKHLLARLTERFRDGLEELRALYLRSLGWTMSHVPTVFVSLAVCLLLTAASFVLIPKAFLPVEDQSFLMSFIQAPEGASPRFTDIAMRKTEAVYASLPETERYFSVVGGFGNGVNNRDYVCDAPR